MEPQEAVDMVTKPHQESKALLIVLEMVEQLHQSSCTNDFVNKLSSFLARWLYFLEALIVKYLSGLHAVTRLNPTDPTHKIE